MYICGQKVVHRESALVTIFIILGIGLAIRVSFRVRVSISVKVNFTVSFRFSIRLLATIAIERLDRRSIPDNFVTLTARSLIYR